MNLLFLEVLLHWLVCGKKVDFLSLVSAYIHVLIGAFISSGDGDLFLSEIEIFNSKSILKFERF